MLIHLLGFFGYINPHNFNKLLIFFKRHIPEKKKNLNNKGLFVTISFLFFKIKNAKYTLLIKYCFIFFY